MSYKIQRAKYLQQRLEQLFPVTPIPLQHSNPFTLLVAVLLSAQCTDARVNVVTPHLFSLATTPDEMIKLSWQEIQKIIRPCGLSEKKAQNIWHLSKILVEKYKSEVPQTLEELEALPGVGRKTASVVLVQAFGQAAFPVDTHIHRLAQAWRLSSGKNVRQTEEDLKKLFPPSLWGKLHLQIIFYGREYCAARSCDAKKCMLCKELALI